MKLLIAVAVFCLCYAVNASELKYVLYSEEGCTPCVNMKAALKEFAIVWVVGIHNVNDAVYAYPTLIIIKDGVEIKRIIGYTNREIFKRGINSK